MGRPSAPHSFMGGGGRRRLRARTGGGLGEESCNHVTHLSLETGLAFIGTGAVSIQHVGIIKSTIDGYCSDWYFSTSFHPIPTTRVPFFSGCTCSELHSNFAGAKTSTADCPQAAKTQKAVTAERDRRPSHSKRECGVSRENLLSS